MFRFLRRLLRPLPAAPGEVLPPAGDSGATPAAAMAPAVPEVPPLTDQNLAAFAAALAEFARALPDDSARFRLAEQLSMAVYPRFLFSEFGRSFLEDESFLAYYRRFMHPDNWHSYDRKYLLDQLLHLADGIDGDFAECGVYSGATAYLLCRAATGSGRRVYLIDSFEGLSEPGPRDGSYWRAGALRSPIEETRANLAEFACHEFVHGWIPDVFAALDGGKRYAFLHVDVDLHRPTLDSLRYFYPRMATGAVILFDDYGFTSCPGARAAIDEFFADKPERIVDTPTGQSFVVISAASRPVPEMLRWTPALVERFWTGVAQTRLAELSFGRTGGRPFVAAIAHLLGADTRALDFGAGDGDIVACLLERGVATAAYEPVPLRRANIAARAGVHPAFLGFAETNTEMDYDLVLMVEVIEHILDADLDAALRRVTGFLRPGGHFIVSTPNNEDLDLSMTYCPRSNALFNRWQHVRAFTAASLSALLQPYGIAPVVVHQMEYQSEYFLPYDPIWCGGTPAAPTETILRLRRHEPVTVGNGSRLLFIGRKS